MGKRVGKDVWMLSLTIDPQYDTPQVLRAYVDNWNCRKPGWLYLTGDYDDITRLRRALGVYDLDPKIDADRTQHAGILTFGNDRTDRWAGLPGRTLPGDIARTVLRLTSRPITLGESRGPATVGGSAEGAGGVLAGPSAGR